MSTVNMIALMPLLKGAIDRHGAYVADLVERSEPSTVAWEASESAALGYAHIESSKTSADEMVFAAQQFEEAAMMYLVAAKILRKGAGQ